MGSALQCECPHERSDSRSRNSAVNQPVTPNMRLDTLFGFGRLRYQQDSGLASKVVLGHAYFQKSANHVLVRDEGSGLAADRIKE
jgi:hypothetical protein